jgi:outer membrane protein OmpA-like peptidoglycan-associated protein
MKHIIRSSTAALVAGVIAAGCSTTPSQSDTAAANVALGNAGHAIDQAASDPHVTQYASSELGRAHDSLRQAQTAWNEDHDLTTTTHLAYLAQQRAVTAKELADQRAAQDAVQVAAAERDHALSVAAAGRRGKPGAEATGTGQVQVAIAGFATGRAELPAAMLPKIDELATMLRDNPDRKIVIQGHTDSIGHPGSNKTLAMQRAQAVRVALYRRGVDPSRVVIESFGETNPVASNDTSAGRRANRRADVMLAEPQAQMARSSTESPGAAATGQSGTSGQTQSGQNEPPAQNQPPVQNEQQKQQPVPEQQPAQ